jgi:hypothetical protein
MLDNGTLDLSTMTAPVAITTLLGTGVVNLGEAGLMLGSASATFGGVISGDGSVEVSGTEIFTGASQLCQVSQNAHDTRPCIACC